MKNSKKPILENYPIFFEEILSTDLLNAYDETHSGIGEILVDDTSLNSVIYHNIFRRQVGDYKEVNLKINVFAELNNLMKQFLDRLDTIITYIIDK